MDFDYKVLQARIREIQKTTDPNLDRRKETATLIRLINQHINNMVSFVNKLEKKHVFDEVVVPSYDALLSLDDEQLETALMVAYRSFLSLKENIINQMK